MNPKQPLAALDAFIANAAEATHRSPEPADCVLEERNFVRLSPDQGADEGIQLVRGGVILLGRGAVTSFVPNPDHIHITGVPPERERVVSLHLYGRMMNSFNAYDIAAGTRRLVNVAHNES